MLTCDPILINVQHEICESDLLVAVEYTDTLEFIRQTPLKLSDEARLIAPSNEYLDPALILDLRLIELPMWKFSMTLTL